MVDPARDLVVLLEACSANLNDAVMQRVRAEVGVDIRLHDGYVFQHLVTSPCSVSELARRLGVSQQAASKHVADLTERRLVVRRRDSRDARSWQISLSARGRRVVEAGRNARRAVTEDLTAALGDATVADLVSRLVQLSTHTGAMDELLRRQLQPESTR
jgi:DNA-binding MarR family transcriptional regulator